MANKTTKVNETKQVRSLSAENTLYSSVSRNTGWRTAAELGLADSLSVDAAKAEVLAQIASGYYNKAAVDAMFSLVNTAEFRGPYESTVFIPKPYDTNDLYLVGVEPPYRIFVYIRADDELKQIGGTSVDLSEYAKKDWVEEKNYQPMLTAGAGVSIVNNVISAVIDDEIIRVQYGNPGMTFAEAVQELADGKSMVCVDGNNVLYVATSNATAIEFKSPILGGYNNVVWHADESWNRSTSQLAAITSIGVGLTLTNGELSADCDVDKAYVDAQDEAITQEMSGRLAEKQDVLTAGENITIVDNVISAAKDAGGGMPLTLNRVKSYFYEADYNEIDYNYALEYFKEDTDVPAGACSSVRNGDFYGRNLDWKYDEMAEFLVRTPHIGGRRASVSICGGITDLTDEFVHSGEKSDLYRIVPFRVYDGINESGVVASVNVVPQDKGRNRAIAAVSTEKTLSVMMLIRFILDYFDTAKDAVEYIRDYVDVFSPDALSDMGYEVHFMVADPTNTYSIEFIDNATVVTSMTAKYMTNFYLDGVTPNQDGTVYTPASVPAHLPSENGITEHGQGLERYNTIVSGYSSANTSAGMRQLLDRIIYTKAYTPSTGWCTEFTGINNLTVDSPASSFIDTMAEAEREFARRTRNGVTWHTVHSSVYNIADKTLDVIAQEDGQSMTYSIPTSGLSEVAWGDITGDIEDQTDLGTALSGKVDKETGKGLSTNDYTTPDKTKLTALADIQTIGSGLTLTSGELSANGGGSGEVVRITYNDANVTFEDVAAMLADGKTVICMKPQSTSHPERYYEYPLSYKYDTYIYFRTVTSAGSVQYIRLNKTGTKWQYGTDLLNQNLTPLSYDGQEDSWASTATTGQMASFIGPGSLEQGVFKYTLDPRYPVDMSMKMTADGTITAKVDDYTDLLLYGGGSWLSDANTFVSYLNYQAEDQDFVFNALVENADPHFNFIKAIVEVSGIELQLPLSELKRSGMLILHFVLDDTFLPNFSDLPLTKKLYMSYEYEPYNVLETSGGGEMNVLEGVQLNGTDLEIVGKKVNIPMIAGSNISISDGVISSSLNYPFSADFATCTDCNSAKTNTIVGTTGTTSHCPPGAQAGARLLTFGGNGSSFRFQIYAPVVAGTNSNIYYRIQKDTTWANWFKFQIDDDSGWVDCTLNSAFKTYSDVAANKPQVRKIGKVVTLRGVLSPSSTITPSSASATSTMFTIPSAYRPPQTVVALEQGSSMNRFCIQITSAGVVSLRSYGTGADTVPIPTTAWLPINMTWMVD